MNFYNVLGAGEQILETSRANSIPQVLPTEEIAAQLSQILACPPSQALMDDYLRTLSDC